ncbi:class I SAM-dependent methyltransferase [Sphingomonas daechungensis]|uniref:class I SAM-dependent methyltransferase n=1 Tax=Sphingomonas daechungensis TaxID=1176646 RepID=UPI003783EBB3
MTRTWPKPVKLVARAIRRVHGLVTMRIGRIRSTRPLSRNWGYDRGTPIDRHYIESFLAANAADVQGHVLEVQEDDYSRRFGGPRITRQDILNVDASNPRATLIGDLADPETLPEGAFDCIILTQTLHLVFDMPAAIRNAYRALKPRGVLLVTVPGISPLDRYEFIDGWYWSLTAPALQRLLSGPFGSADVEVKTYGNLYAATAFLHAAAVEEVSRRKLDDFDRIYPVTIAARAVKTTLD